MEEIHDLMRDARKRGALDAVLTRTAETLNDESGKQYLYDDRTYVRLVQGLSAEARAMLQKARERTFRVTYNALSMMISARNTMRTWEWNSANDRRFVAEVRCMIIDAETFLARGQFEEVRERLEQAVHQLNWLMHERRYGGDRASRQPPPHHVQQEAEAVIGTLDLIATDLDNLTRSVA